MRIEKDFRDFVRLFNTHKVEYILVGAYALAYHGLPRATQDFDLYIRPTLQNALKVAQALEEFGFAGLNRRDLSRPGKMVMLGRPPMRIDLLTRITGVTWQTAWKHRVLGTYGDVPINIIGKKEVIANKRAAGRIKDLADLEALGEAPGQKTVTRSKALKKNRKS